MEIEVFPKRLLSSDTLEQLLDSINRLGMAKNVILQGPKLPRNYGNIMTIRGDERRIRFGEKEIDLEVKVGRIIIQPKEGVDLQIFLNDLREICNVALPFGFSIRTGLFTKQRPTVSDFIRKSIS